MLNTTIRNKALAALALASTLGFASAAQAQAPLFFWSSVGSAGTIDSGSTASAKAMRATLTTGSTGTLIARYSVTPSIEFTGGGVLHLMANLVDPGPGASLSVSLIEVPVGKPGETAAFQAGRQILTVNSTDDAMGVVVNSCVNDDGKVRLDFEANVYFVQAVLNWDALAQPQAPQLRAIRLAVYDFKKCGE
jgi:hypothetical protein